MQRRYQPDLPVFLALAARGRMSFVFREIVADADTPVSVFAKLGRKPYSFLLESVVGGEKWANFSFVGVGASQVVRAKGDQVEILLPVPGGDRYAVAEQRREANPVEYLAGLLRDMRAVVPEGLPRFFGGAVGYLGYDAVRYFERLPERTRDDLELPDLCFAITDTVVVFDNLRGTVKVVAAAPFDGVAPETAYADACRRIDRVIETLSSGHNPMRPIELAGSPAAGESRGAEPSAEQKQRYQDGVARIKEYIRAGDAFQVVLSQRFEVDRAGVDAFDVYRGMRVSNPSPYMFHLEFPEATVTGASPECLVRLEGDRIEVRPIAGTRPRGRNSEEDRALELELAADPKERAEHVMLIDLGRNDVGRVSRQGSVRVDEVMMVERYSHVMHIVSNVCGTLAAGQDAAGVIKATFPAGTLSGAPKIRAMEIIEELETTRRGVYGGAVGYLSFQGNADLAIAIRTVVGKHGSDGKGGTFFVQAGAGIVADSQPAAEQAECENKARAVLLAIEQARRIPE